MRKVVSGVRNSCVTAKTKRGPPFKERDHALQSRRYSKSPRQHRGPGDQKRLLCGRKPAAFAVGYVARQQPHRERGQKPRQTVLGRHGQRDKVGVGKQVANIGQETGPNCGPIQQATLYKLTSIQVHAASQDQLTANPLRNHPR